MPLERKPLFRPDVLRPRLLAFDLPQRVVDNRHLLAKWAALLKSPEGDRLKEQEILGDFLTDVFVTLLGYTRPADNPQRYTISREQHVEAFGKFADGVLGEFHQTPPSAPGGEGMGERGRRFVVAPEGKGPTDPLDRPFKSRALSAVDQGYRYAINLLCDWIIITSMRNTRLYCKGTDQLTYELFPIADLATNEHLLKKFVFLLGAERVVPTTGRCHLDTLREASDKAGRELTRDFYQRYANMREDVFEQLCAHNAQHSRHDVLSATQHLLDRVLFCAFCEDRGLLPDDTLTRAFSHRDPYNPRHVWENFRGLFRSINIGNPELHIPPYNGGLFALDPVTDAITVPDAVCHHFKELSEYDYRAASAVSDEDDRSTPPSPPEGERVGERGRDGTPSPPVGERGSRGALVDVDILGHVFEQSISDLEQIRNELDGLIPAQGKEKHKTRRKKEGAFYTPVFITRYIVEQTLGKVLADRFEQLRATFSRVPAGRASRTAASKALADPRVYDRDALKKPERDALINFWEAWQDELATIRVLDPACGSGAFLIEAFDHLYAEYQRASDRLTELQKQQPSLFDPDARILQNNLYGVDLNEEAIQICRLSLWIKTAHPDCPLTSLDHTIRVGNSVVDDPAVHPRAFDWQHAFPEVTQAGGFDVVLGNPPYIRQEWIKPFKAHWEQRFTSFSSTADIFTYFFEIGVERLRPNGLLGFITSGSWVFSNFGGPIRRFMATNSKIESLIDFGEYQPFEGAEMIRPTILISRKAMPSGTMRLFKWLTSGTPPETLSDLIGSASTVTTSHLSQERWELKSDDVRELRAKMFGAGKALASRRSQRIYAGIKSGRNEAFVIDATTRQRLCQEHPSSADIIFPYVMGTDVQNWHLINRERFIIFTKQGIAIDEYPAIHRYLEQFRPILEPKPDGWDSDNQGQKWPGRKPGTYRWYEIQDSSDFHVHFSSPKIIWPDIAKLPRFLLDSTGAYLDMTCFMIPINDPYVYGVLSSWATWFLISKTCQPLRLRGDRWQYRLKKQWISKLPIPDASTIDRREIGTLALNCSATGQKRHDLKLQFCRRLEATFGDPAQSSTLNNKAQQWWEHSLTQLGAALKASFKSKDNPFKNPSLADAWEPYLAEKKAEVARLTRELADAEAELNDRVYRLFDLTPDEIRLLQREVEH